MMLKRVLVALMLIVAAFSGYVYGQRDIRPLPGEPKVFAGPDLGFRAHGVFGDPVNGSGWLTGQFVVKVEGKWVEARLGGSGRQP